MTSDVRKTTPMPRDQIEEIRAQVEARWNSKPWYQGEDSPKCMMMAHEILGIVAALSEAEAAASSARRRALLEAAEIVEENMLCGSDGEEVLRPRGDSGNKVGFAFAAAIRQLAEPNADEAGAAEPADLSVAKAFDLNSWFLSLPAERQKIIREDKWMLAEAAFAAGLEAAAGKRTT